MLVLGVPALTAKILYCAVKYCAGWAWNGNKKAKEQGCKKFIDIPDVTIEIPEIQLKGFLPDRL